MLFLRFFSFSLLSIYGQTYLIFFLAFKTLLPGSYGTFVNKFRFDNNKMELFFCN